MWCNNHFLLSINYSLVKIHQKTLCMLHFRAIFFIHFTSGQHNNGFMQWSDRALWTRVWLSGVDLICDQLSIHGCFKYFCWNELLMGFSCADLWHDHLNVDKFSNYVFNARKSLSVWCCAMSAGLCELTGIAVTDILTTMHSLGMFVKSNTNWYVL